MYGAYVIKQPFVSKTNRLDFDLLNARSTELVTVVTEQLTPFN